MRKAEVTLKEGFRYYRLDNHYYDVKAGDTVDLDDMIPRDAQARIQAGHVKLIEPVTHADEAAADAAKKKADADKVAADEADAKSKGKK